MPYTFKLRRGTAAEWSAINPILREGEPGVDLDTGQLKLGNGVSNWLTLPYLISEDAVKASYLPIEVVSAGVNGVVGDGITVDAAAIQVLNDRATANDTQLYIGPGDFNLGTDTLRITASLVMHPLARLLYSGLGIAVLIDSADGIEGYVRVEKTNLSWDTGVDLTSIGVRVKNTSGARLAFRSRGFSVGVEMYGDGAGTAYNVIDLREVRENKRCLVFTATDTESTGIMGWANANEFRGWLRISSGYGSYAGTRLIDLSTTGNGNTFLGVTLEGVMPEKTLVVKNTDNIFLNCRWEGVKDDGVELLAGSYANYIIGGYGNFGPGSTIFLDNGLNIIIGSRGMQMGSDSASAAPFNDGLAAYEAIPFTSNNDKLYAARNLLGNRTWAVNALGVAETKHSAESFPRVRSAAQGGPANYGGVEFGRGNIEPDAKIGRSAGTVPAVEANVPIKPLSATTVNRPSPLVGEGSIMFDKTLGKHIYSDGTNWRRFSDDVIV